MHHVDPLPCLHHGPHGHRFQHYPVMDINPYDRTSHPGGGAPVRPPSTRTPPLPYDPVTTPVRTNSVGTPPDHPFHGQFDPHSRASSTSSAAPSTSATATPVSSASASPVPHLPAHTPNPPLPVLPPPILPPQAGAPRLPRLPSLAAAAGWRLPMPPPPQHAVAPPPQHHPYPAPHADPTPPPPQPFATPAPPKRPAPLPQDPPASTSPPPPAAPAPKRRRGTTQPQPQPPTPANPAPPKPTSTVTPRRAAQNREAQRNFRRRRKERVRHLEARAALFPALAAHASAIEAGNARIESLLHTLGASGPPPPPPTVAPSAAPATAAAAAMSALTATAPVPSVLEAPRAEAAEPRMWCCVGGEVGEAQVAFLREELERLKAEREVLRRRVEVGARMVAAAGAGVGSGSGER
ncbi:hypothetical protein HDU96_007427 [Phlyctochytrium bullatum]|nr:hypothetical protein HDU96_007427 [Phlyctochytrium bullatum]